MTSSPTSAQRALRPYQDKAVEAAGRDLTDHDAAQLHMACGTGKTIVELRVAEQVAPHDGLIVVAVPTIALVDQVLREWRTDTERPFAALAVCSDDTAVDAPVHLADLTASVTTDPDEVADWIGATPGLRVVATTYLSASVVADALRSRGMLADLLVCDEAHHLTGRTDYMIRRILDRESWPARRRLFATATPRVDLRRSPGDFEVAGMDDEDVFGPVAARYTFGEAIKDGWLKDYRVAVIGVSEAEALALLAETDVDYVVGAGEAPLQLLAAQVALLRAHQQFGVSRAITFHPRIADAAEFARTLGRTVDRVDDTGARLRLTARHVHGGMDTRQRQAALAALRSPVTGGDWVVIANSRCLSEGVDIPAVDAVVFAHPKRSPVDIIQAVGRALRRRRDDPSDQVATIVVPIVIADTGDDAPGDVDPGDYRTVWQVVRALRAHDDELGIALDLQRANDHSERDSPDLPERISVVLPPGTADHVLAQLRLMLIEETTSPWWEHYGAAQRYYAEHGHLKVLYDYVAPDRRRLGQWVAQQRRAQARLLDEQRAALDAIGMIWDRYDEAWMEMYARAAAWVEQHGHARVPATYVTDDGERLGTWVSTQRQRMTDGTIREDRRQRLAEIGLQPDQFHDGLAVAAQYRAEHGHLQVPQSYVDPTGYPLGQWIGRQRDRAKGRNSQSLSDTRRAALDELGMVWDLSRQARALTAEEADELRAARGRVATGDIILRLCNDGAAQAAIADVLGVSPNTVSSRLATARRRARDGAPSRRIDLTLEQKAEISDPADRDEWIRRARLLRVRDGVSVSAIARASGLSIPTAQARLRSRRREQEN